MVIIENKNLPEKLSAEEFEYYYRQMKSGDETARRTIIEHNLRLVIAMINKHFGSVSFPDDELFQTGTIGLIKATDTYILNEQTKFSSYAAKCIINEIKAFLKAENKNKHDSFERPSTSPEGESELSYEDKLFDDDDTVEASIDKSQTYLVINKVLNLLDPKEKLVIVLTYGFYGKERKTQQEIAAILGLSRSYVATILGSALNNIVILLKREWELEENFNMKARRKSPIIPLSDRFPGYTEEDYWNVITTLKEEERALIFKRYGIDLKNTASSDEWNYAESKDPYNAVIKKLASRLEALAKQKKLGVKR